MNNVDEKIADTKKELNKWLDSTNAEDFYYHQPINKIKSMADNSQILKSILTNFGLVSTWYNNNFVYDMLIKGSSDYRVKTSILGYQMLAVADAFEKVYPNNPPTSISFDYAAYYLANIVILNWEKEAENIIKIINRNLSTKLFNNGLDFKITSWFIFEIVNKGFNIDYNYSEFNYPENMGVYKKALDNWNTKDLSLVDEIISDFCTFHIFQASRGSLSDSAGKSDPMFIQFSHPAWYVYAFEVLVWLAVRELSGLQNPENFSHGLMQISINKPIKEKIKVPNDILFDKILNKIKI